MNKPNIILIGGGGHCNSCIDVIEQEDKFAIAGIIDVKEKVGQKILGYPIIGSDDDLPEIAERYDNFLITLGQIKSTTLRTKLYQRIKISGKKLPIIISPNAYVTKHSTIGEGTIIMHQALVNAGTSIGANCIINTKALIEHNTTIEDYCHISTNTTINGNCIINSGTFIGSNTVLNQGITVAQDCVVGSGSVVNNSILIPETIWFGNPAAKK
jgi:sugar O-acyltransferase (sialic acid O-acetyltransferase NeuD family)